MEINIDELIQRIEDEILRNLEIGVVEEDLGFYEPYNYYKVILTYKDKVISTSDTIDVPIK